MIDQQPVVDSEGDAEPMAWHGPPIPSGGVVGPGAEIAGAYVVGDGIIDGKVLAPVISGIGLGIGLVGTGLSPPLPISTEPRGIPEGVPRPGVEVDIAEDGVLLVEPVPHVATVVVPLGDGIPIVIPPPS
jgi:hypothetical protein